MSTQGASVYEATLPFAPSGTVIAYYLSVSDSNGEVGIVHPKGAALDPANLPHFVLVGYTLNASETAESVGGLGAFQPGVPGDNATGGQWALGVPIPSYAQQGIPSSIVQPGTQHTPGGQNCWFTGNAVGPEAATGANDVDAGTTTLRSALFDASALQNPVISYWRWYVNNAAEGTNPGTDPWTVSISAWPCASAMCSRPPRACACSSRPVTACATTSPSAVPVWWKQQWMTWSSGRRSR
jgi:hypothetical protein